MVERTPELERAAQSFHDLKNAIADREAVEQEFATYREQTDSRITQLEHQLSLSEQHSNVLDKENENLRGQVKRANGQRDHWMRTHSALKSYLLTLKPSIDKAIEMAESHSYGEKAPQPSTDISTVRANVLTTEQQAHTLRVLDRAVNGG